MSDRLSVRSAGYSAEAKTDGRTNHRRLPGTAEVVRLDIIEARCHGVGKRGRESFSRWLWLARRRFSLYAWSRDAE